MPRCGGFALFATHYFAALGPNIEYVVRLFDILLQRRTARNSTWLFTQTEKLPVTLVERLARKRVGIWEFDSSGFCTSCKGFNTQSYTADSVTLSPTLKRRIREVFAIPNVRHLQ